jgi:ankyrin repeat protein/predicted Ser/Thr protein kinase
MPRPVTGAFASVYSVRSGGKRWAVRCFKQQFPDYQQRYSAIGAYLKKAKLSYTVDFEFLAKGILVNGSWYPIVKMEWVEGRQLNEYVRDFRQAPEKLAALAARWRDMTKALSAAGIAHGDLQHGNVLVVGDQLRLVDYDGMFVPALRGRGSNERGHPSYQHPRRTGSHFDASIDRFSNLAILVALRALALRPELWQKFNNDDNLLFREGDYKNPTTSDLFRKLEGAGGDATFRDLVRALQAASTGPIERVPALDDVVPARGLVPVTNAKRPVWLDDFLPGATTTQTGRTGTGQATKRDQEPARAPATGAEPTSGRVRLKGRKIRHKVFGHGVVLESRKSGDTRIILVRFDSGEEKKLDAAHTSITFLPSTKAKQVGKTSMPSGPATAAPQSPNVPASTVLRSATVASVQPVILGVLGVFDQNGFAPLHNACLNRSISDVAALLRSGALADVVGKGGRTPLHVAASVGFLEGVKALLRSGAGVNFADNNGSSPLHLAAEKNQTETVKFLLAHGADVVQVDHQRRTPRDVAALAGHTALTSLLSPGGPSASTSPAKPPTTVPSPQRTQPAPPASPQAKSAKKTATFARGSQFNPTTPSSPSAPTPADSFRTAVVMRDLGAVEMHLKRDPNLVHHRNAKGRTALHDAVAKMNIEMVKVLMRLGPDLDAMDSDGDTPLTLANSLFDDNIRERMKQELGINTGPKTVKLWFPWLTKWHKRI